MGRRFLLAAVLSAVLVTMPASPAPAQLSAEGAPPPEYRVGGDGSLTIGGDVVVPCSTITNPYATEGGTPEERRAAEEAARACEAAGFGASAPAASASAPADDGPRRADGSRHAQDAPDFGSASPVPSDSDYQITDDGHLIYGGDTAIACEDVRPEGYASSALYEEQAEVCAGAGFPPGEALPETGGPPLLLGPLALLLGAGMLVRAIAPAES